MLSKFLAFRERFAGTIQDICAALSMLAFLITVFLWTQGLAG